MIDIYEFMTWTKEERQAHLDLSSSCEERGSNSSECRGLLAVALNTTLPKGTNIHCCHACHNGACSNWKHLYWGTAKENYEDMAEAGNAFTPKGFEAGVHHPSFGMPPWRYPQSKKEEWSWASDVYDDYLRKEFSFHAYGFGYRAVSRKYGISDKVSYLIVKKFKDGWIPYNDPEWLEDFELEQFGLNR